MAAVTSCENTPSVQTYVITRALTICMENPVIPGRIQMFMLHVRILIESFSSLTQCVKIND